MGIHDRDYYRDDPRPAPIGVSVTTGLIVLHVFLFFMLALGANGLAYWGQYTTHGVARGEVWRLLTAQLIPVRDLLTVVIGMFLLHWVGRELEAARGPRGLIVFYLAAAFVGGLTKFVLAKTGVEVNPAAFGMASPLFAAMVLFACHAPRQVVMFLMVLPIQVGHLVAGLLAVYILAAALRSANDGTLLDAPSVVAAAGFALCYHAATTRRVRRPRLRIAPEPPRQADRDDDTDDDPSPARPTPARPRLSVDEHLEAKLDEVLEKLARIGPDRLTPDERDVLKRASEAYQQRRK